MKVAFMQPYLFPYLGYFQLMTEVDYFGVLDDVQYINRGWINRNRILHNGQFNYITLPVTKASHQLKIKERYYAETFTVDKTRIINQLDASYKKAPFYKETMDLVRKLFEFEERNVSVYNTYQLKSVCEYLGIQTNILTSDAFVLDEPINVEEDMINRVKCVSGDHYINAINGRHLYTFENFSRNRIKLNFIQMQEVEYKQFENDFIPDLSIIDVLMFNDLESVQGLLKKYQLI